MCGIAGIINTNGHPVPPRRLQRMADAISHRGPDGEGYWIEGNVGIGHRCQSASKGDPGSACKKNRRRASFCWVQGRHPSAPAHAVAEPARGTAVKNGRFISGRPQGLFLRAVSTAA